MNGIPLRHTVPADAVSERADRYLARVFPKVSRSKLHKQILEGQVRIGGWVLRKPSYIITPGEEFTVEVLPSEPPDVKPDRIKLEIVHEDSFLMVVSKPAGMVSHPAPGHTRRTLVNALVGYGSKLSKAGGAQKLGIVHRLDQDTSGLVVVAKDDRTHLALAKQFAGRQVKRVYRALVRGAVQRDEGTIDAPIGRDPHQRKLMSVQSAGREAITRYKVLERFRGATYLELTPQTGRTHQLRVHLKHIGHPILGDAHYGIRGGFRRQALHAHRLGFVHPGIEQWVEFVSPMPADLEKEIRRLRENGPKLLK